MNYFMINEKFAIVDLPGYGFAKVSQTEQQKWRKELENYLLKRENLVAVIQFIDGRHEVQKNDLQMREWVNYHGLKVYTIVTKMDYVNKTKKLSILKNIEKTLGDEVIPFSTEQPICPEVFELLEKLSTKVEQ